MVRPTLVAVRSGPWNGPLVAWRGRLKRVHSLFAAWAFNGAAPPGSGVAGGEAVAELKERITRLSEGLKRLREWLVWLC